MEDARLETVAVVCGSFECSPEAYWQIANSMCARGGRHNSLRSDIGPYGKTAGNFFAYKREFGSDADARAFVREIATISEIQGVDIFAQQTTPDGVREILDRRYEFHKRARTTLEAA